METCKISSLYTLSETIAEELFQDLTYPWEALPKISQFICELGAKLDSETYEKKGEHVWIARSNFGFQGPAITALSLLTKKQKCATALLSGETPL